MSQAIRASGLEKTFVKRRPIGQVLRSPFGRAERVHALRGVDLEIRPGEIFGLLGPNGAGKTTLLKILCCLVLPDRGRAEIGGRPTTDESAVKRAIGLVQTDERSFYWRLSGRENLRFFARIYDVPGPRIAERIGELLARVEMADAADRPFGGYSSGMKQRMAIARALLHDPPVLLMDEPTRSLDPASSLAVRGFIDRELRRRDGKTILLASHNLREIEALADRVAILVRGRVRRVGTIAEVRSWGVDDERYALELETTAAELPAGAWRVIADRSAGRRRRIVVAFERGRPLDDVLRPLIGAGARILACERLEPDLEEAFSRAIADGDGESA